MAILKRASIIIAGHKGVYVRVASEHQSQTIHRFEGGGVIEDRLTSTHKSFYSKYKDGVYAKYSGYEEKLQVEADFISDLLATSEEKEYMRRGATYDSWAEEADTAPVEYPPTPRSRPASSNAAQSPVIKSPPPKMMKKSEDDDADEEAAKAMHSD